MSLLRAESIRKHFEVRDPFRSGRRLLPAVDGVDFDIDEDRVFGLVGESGCGKSTVARLVLRLIPPTGGRVLFQGQDVRGFGKDSLREFRKSVQIVFQDPFASLNPRRRVFDTLAEPLVIHRLAGRGELRDRTGGLLRKVGLDLDALDRYPHEFSGGQRQRICIARALAVSPRLIVADEPLSALDVSIQAQILNLLRSIREEARLSFLFISHDLNVVRYFSDEVAVMYLGKIVEQAATDGLFQEPLHPYTRILLASAPKIGAERGRRHEVISGDVPSPVDIPPGCPFHPRCPERFGPCDKTIPRLETPVAKGFRGRIVACHLWNPY